MTRLFSLSLLFGLLCMTSPGCTSEEVYARTQMLVRIGTSDQEIRRNLTSLRVALFAESEGRWEPGASAAYERSAIHAWPVELPIVPRRGAELERAFEVVVDVLDEHGVSAQTRAVTSFIDGKKLVLSLWLERCPGGRESSICEPGDCHGRDCKICRKGACVRVQVTNPKNLSEWSESTSSNDDADGGARDARGDVIARDGSAPGDSSTRGESHKDGAPSDSCSDDGELRCAMPGTPERQRCESGSWQPSDPCTGGQICDAEASEPGSCRDLVAVCVGSSDQTVCDGELMLLCDGKGGSTKSLPCKSAAHCERGKAAGACAICLPNEHQCTGSDLEVCTDDGQSYKMKARCGGAAPCNAAAGACGTGCTAQAKACAGDELRVCSADGSGFTTEETCEPGLCDDAGQECDDCVPGTNSCAGNMVQTCASDGQGFTAKACAAPKSICTGNGTCVECTATQPCATPSEPCMTASCNVATGTCETTPKASGVTCPTGFCDGEGDCGECRNGETKSCGTDVGECALGRQTCTNGSWGSCTGGTSATTEGCNDKDDDCDGTIDDQATCPIGQACLAGQCQRPCGNQRVDNSEQCDPSAPGYTTFTCTDDCRSRSLYGRCAQDPTNPLGPSPDCKADEFCAGYGGGTGPFCVPRASTAQGCPKITGFTWVVAGLSGEECLLPCSPGRAGDCPSIAPTCFQNPFSQTPAGWCTR